MCAVHAPSPLTATSSAITCSSERSSSRSSSSSPETHVLGQRAQEAHLRARQSGGGAQLFGIVGEDLRGRRRAPAEALGQPAVDRPRGRHRQLLADDRAHERAIVIVAVRAAIARVAERADGIDQTRRARGRRRAGARPPCPRSRGLAALARVGHRCPRASRGACAVAPCRPPPVLSPPKRCVERDRLAVERVQRALQRHRDAREARRVPDRVARGLGRAQALHEVEERADVVRVERHHELLVVEAERVRRVVVDARVFPTDLDVPLHDPPALVGRQRVPLARLHERVHEHVPAPECPRDRALVLRVFGALPHAQERVGDLRPLHQAALREHDVELVDAVEVLCLGDQQELGVSARTHERERLEQMAVGEVLARGHELALVPLALLVIEAAPRRVELQKRVLHEVPRAHSARLSHRPRAAEALTIRTRSANIIMCGWLLEGKPPGQREWPARAPPFRRPESG